MPRGFITVDVPDSVSEDVVKQLVTTAAMALMNTRELPDINILVSAQVGDYEIVPRRKRG